MSTEASTNIVDETFTNPHDFDQIAPSTESSEVVFSDVEVATTMMGEDAIVEVTDCTANQPTASAEGEMQATEAETEATEAETEATEAEMQATEAETEAVEAETEAVEAETEATEAETEATEAETEATEAETEAVEAETEAVEAEMETAEAKTEATEAEMDAAEAEMKVAEAEMEAAEAETEVADDEILSSTMNTKRESPELLPDNTPDAKRVQVSVTTHLQEHEFIGATPSQNQKPSDTIEVISTVALDVVETSSESVPIKVLVEA